MITSLGFLGETLMYGNDELSATLDLPAKTIVFRLDTNQFNPALIRNSGWGEATEILQLDPYTFQITYPLTDWSHRFGTLNGYLTEVIAFNAEGITNLNLCFGQSHELTKVNILINTDSVTDMSYMFQECKSLNSLDISSFDTSSVVNLSNMFCYCEMLESVDLSSFDISSVTDAGYMFSHCSSLTTKNKLAAIEASEI